MKMKTIFAAVATVAAASAWSAGMGNPKTKARAGMSPLTEAARVAALPEAEREAKREEARRRVMEMHGGIIDKNGIGAMAVVNCQSRVNMEKLAGKIADLKRFLRMELVELNGTFAVGAVKIPENANIAVFVVDDPALPQSLVAVESKWGMMNVAPILDGNVDESTAEKRIAKMFVRVASLTFGGGGSQYSGSPLQPVFSTADLDHVVGEGFTVDVIGAISRNLNALGMKPSGRCTYRRACEEGWAPAPTNEFQKAIWEKVHAVPKNPMKIEFDPKKGK